jgi:hypothetical protein
MYSSYLTLDADANPYNYDIEVPMQHVDSGDYDVQLQLRRNLTIGGKPLLATPSMPFNFTILWAYRIHSVMKGMCNDFTNIPKVTEAASFSIVLGASQYKSRGPNTCNNYKGKLSALRRALSGSEGFFAGENHQNQRIAILYIGGGLPLASGKNVPIFDSAQGYVLVGEGGNDVCHASVTVAYGRWKGFRDPVGGIAYYEVSFGSPYDLQQYLPWTDVGSAASVAKSVDLPKNGTIILTVRAYNYAGRYIEVRSRAAHILSGSAPMFGVVYDGTSFKTDISAQRSGTTISATWPLWRTEDYSTKSLTTGQWTHNPFEYAIGILGKNATAIKNWQPTTSTFVTLTNLKLRHNVRYYVSVRAKNCAGAMSTAASNGVLVDLYPPTKGQVYDGNVTYRDTKYLQVNSGVYASWGGFTDTSSGINHYEWAVGTKDPKQYGTTTELLSWRHVGLQTYAYNISLRKATKRLSIGSTVWVHVRAIDNVGWSTTASSNGTQVIGY